MWLATISCQWEQGAGGAYVPTLASVLQPGDSFADDVGSPNVVQQPNSNTWRCRLSAATLDAIEADARFVVLWSEEIADASA